MIAADTNVLVRLIVNDDARQVALIEQVMAEQPLFVSLTVLLETGWVLASRYRMTREQIAAVMAALLALERVEVARTELVARAIERFRAGADWADMIHLVAAHKVRGFLTFDRGVDTRAGPDASVAVRTLR